MVKVRSVRETSSRIVVEIEKTQFKPSAKERKLEKNVKEAVDQLNKSRDEFDFERKKYNNQIKIERGGERNEDTLSRCPKTDHTGKSA